MLTKYVCQIYCAIIAIINPSKFSVASVAVLQHSSMSRRSIQTIQYMMGSFQWHVRELKNLYGISEIKMKLQEGDVAYPSPDSEQTGMAFELR
jgi:hypothetical protein